MSMSEDESDSYNEEYECVIAPIPEADTRQIVAGQAISDLASTVKELIDNALDAGAKGINIKLFNKGVDVIEVSDDGSGVPRNCRPLVAMKHATSKIRSFEDLSRDCYIDGQMQPNQLGFRGEALFSIANISQNLIISTRTASDSIGQRLEFQRDGYLNNKSVKDVQRKVGTTVAVVKLFDAFPVRRADFIKRIGTQVTNLLKLVQSYAILCVGVRFNVVDVTGQVGAKTCKSEVKLNTSDKNKAITDNISALFGSKFLAGLCPIVVSLGGIIDGRSMENNNPNIWRIEGLISKASDISDDGKIAREMQCFSINGRPVELPCLAKSLNEMWRKVYSNSSGGKKRPACMLGLFLPHSMFDVNIVPNKREVLISEESAICEIFQDHVYNIWTSQRGGQFRAGEVEVASTMRCQNALNSVRSEKPLEELDSKPGGRREGGKMRRRNAFVIHVGNIGKGSPDNEASASNSQMPVTARNLKELSYFKTVPNIEQFERNTPMDISNDCPPAKSHAETPNGDHSIGNHSNGGVTSMDTTNTDQDLPKERQPIESGTEANNRPRRNLTDMIDSGTPLSTPIDHTNGEHPDEIEQQRLRKRPKQVCEYNRDNVDDSTHKISHDDAISHGGASHLNTLENFKHRNELQSEESNPSISGGKRRSTASKTSSLDRRRWDQLKLQFSHNESGSQKEEIQKLKSFSMDERVEDLLNRPSQNVSNVNDIFQEHGDDRNTHSDIEISIPQSHSNKSEQVGMKKRKQNKTTKDTHSQLDNGETGTRSTTVVWNGFDTANNITKLAQKNRLQMATNRKNLLEARKTMRLTPQDKRDGTSTAGTMDSSSFSNEKTVSLSKEDFVTMKIIGQFNLGFILATCPDNHLWILDQHACDEKYNFENICAKTRIHEQKLIAPLPLELSPSEENCVIENMDIFEQNGFRFHIDDSKGPRHRLSLTALPHSGSGGDGRKAVQFGKEDVGALCAILGADGDSSSSSYLAGSGTGADGAGSMSNNAVRRYAGSGGAIIRLPKAVAMFASRACRSSIMIGDSLSHQQMEQIVRRMNDVEQPWDCPHGRPTIRHVKNLVETILSDEEAAKKRIAGPSLAVMSQDNF